MLCQYKDIFGKPNEGVHSIRMPFFHFSSDIRTHSLALVDVLGTLGLAYLLTLYIDIHIIIAFIILMILSIFIHKLFCVDTALTLLYFS